MMKELVDMQEKEVELAVVDRGEYTLHPAFERLRVAASQWAQMSYDQQQTALSTPVVLKMSLTLMCQP
jgi:hypothetical protein